jgi:hypothetical protein
VVDQFEPTDPGVAAAVPDDAGDGDRATDRLDQADIVLPVGSAVPH